jgi:hypothetical protein
VLLATGSLHAKESLDEFPVLEGRYFGQEPPGSTPELFAPEIMNAKIGYHTTIIFSPDLSEAYWSPMEREHCLMFSRIIDGQWTTPERINFGFEEGVGDAALFPSKNRLYFLSFHSPFTRAPKRERIWYVERTEDGWTGPKLIDDIVVAHPTHWTFSFAENGNLYFTSEMKGVRGEQDIYIARFDGAKYLPPEDAGEFINSDGMDMAPFVAPDESYLIFTRSGIGTGKSDIYISFRDSAGNWTEAQSMGEEINSDAHELCASVSPDGKYLFFVSQKDDLMNKIYWVDAKYL